LPERRRLGDFAATGTSLGRAEAAPKRGTLLKKVPHRYIRAINGHGQNPEQDESRSGPQSSNEQDEGGEKNGDAEKRVVRELRREERTQGHD
jgi:hypothetical protein